MAEGLKPTSPSSTRPDRLSHLTSPLGVLVPGPFPSLQAGHQLPATIPKSSSWMGWQ